MVGITLARVAVGMRIGALDLSIQTKNLFYLHHREEVTNIPTHSQIFAYRIIVWHPAKRPTNSGKDKPPIYEPASMFQQRSENNYLSSRPKICEHLFCKIIGNPLIIFNFNII